MKIHAQERYGSAGCVSTPASAAWDRFRAAVAHLNKESKVDVSVSYASNLEVDYYRGMVKE